MLTEQTRETIRRAYNAIVENKGLSPRWGQRQMIAAIANTLGRIDDSGEAPADEPAVCVIEAGTGTGKTIAYAVAAIPLAQALGKRLVVATATVALQEQFVNKDLPDIRQSSGLSFSHALAKGRRRYVCLSKLDRLLAQGGSEGEPLPLFLQEADGPAAAEAAPFYDAMAEALGRGQWDGDRDNWPQSVPDAVWNGVTTDHSQCSGRRCPNIGQCSFYRAREDLQSADIIVTNHDLALSDLALGGGAILPPPQECIYIFDEGHHLPDKALAHFASFCRLHATSAWLQDSVKTLAQSAQTLAAIDGVQQPLQELPARMDDAIASLQVAEQTVAQMFEPADVVAGGEDRQLRFPHGMVPEPLRDVATTLTGLFERLCHDLSRIEARLEDALEDNFDGLDKTEIETLHINQGAMLGRAEGALALWRDYAGDAAGEDPPRARWITLVNSGGQYGFDLRCSHVLASDILADCLWSRAAGVVVTSATLTALGSFERFILHSGAPREAVFKVVSSPFRYENASFEVPAMDCDPGDSRAHTAELIARLPHVLEPDAGALVLFSSRRQMLDVSDGLRATLGERLLVQGDYSKQEIVRRHRERIDAGLGSVIFGLASFAEGVDLPGDYCRHVVIAKIPFAVPDSPLEAALAEWFESRGRNPFMEMSVPDAALRLVQASGRLLRTEADTGRVTLMDRRIVTRRYGRAILDSLPPFRRELG